MVRTIPLALVLLGVLAWAAPASATPNFPQAVAGHLGLASAPGCTLCHAGTPGRGTVTTPFGQTLRSRGAAAYDQAALERALDALAAERKDSDKDGTPDIDELRAGGDPNAAAGEEPVTPEYGVACAASPRGGGSAWSFAWILAPFAWARRRRARRSRHLALHLRGGGDPASTVGRQPQSP